MERKIETQGSGGIEFALTDQDIQEADCVLLATDVAVSGTERFKGKPVVKVLFQQQLNHRNIY